MAMVYQVFQITHPSIQLFLTYFTHLILPSIPTAHQSTTDFIEISLNPNIGKLFALKVAN